ncbi:oligoribonuclease [Pseudomonas aeruginosa]|uniref:oligoribonuclease n=2 Tax=Pseudomonas aeruginosa TaxID=287 RepID=UPI0019121FD8|nr:oligoribonuclease [Pseudomonas aeruginosa]
MHFWLYQYDGLLPVGAELGQAMPHTKSPTAALAAAPTEWRPLVWIDLETTGFTELSRQMVYRHLILEIGVVVTDCDFNVLAQKNVVVSHPIDTVRERCDATVLRMHTDNGLLEEVEGAAVTLAEAEVDILAWLVELGVAPKSSPLCGNGLQLDRSFLEAQMPRLNEQLHYRNLDISSVKEFLKTLSPAFEPPKRRSHRALDDILESVDEARTYRSLIAPALAEAILRH